MLSIDFLRIWGCLSIVIQASLNPCIIMFVGTVHQCICCYGFSITNYYHRTKNGAIYCECVWRCSYGQLYLSSKHVTEYFMTSESEYVDFHSIEIGKYNSLLTWRMNAMMMMSSKAFSILHFHFRNSVINQHVEL